MSKDLAYYRARPYTRRCRLCLEDAETFWHAWIVELPGCEVDGENKASAFANLEEVFEDYINTKLEWGSPIQEPSRWPRFLVDAVSTAQAAEVETRVVGDPLAEGYVDAEEEPSQASGNVQTLELVGT